MPLLKQRSVRATAASFASILISSLVLASCGGGGGGSQSHLAASAAGNTGEDSVGAQENSQASAQPETVAPSAANTMPRSSAGDLLISEVATNYYANDVAWFEVHNPTDRDITLSAYTLRSGAIDTGSYASAYAPVTFALPDVAVPSNGYLVIASRIYANLRDNPQIVYISQGSSAPYWNGSGSLELVKEGRTVDFVRFGTSTAAPLTASGWQGANVPALPAGASEHGKSIVRLASGALADSQSARDWSLVNFATPAGMNDIAPGVIDSDGDGIPDSAKVSGGTYAGIDLYAMGARRGRRDLFIEIDYMTSTDPGVTPRREALQKLVDAFAEKNIAVHIDAGNLHGAAFDPAQFNLGGGNPVEFAACIQLSADAAQAGCTSFYDYKSRHFDVRRKLLFHYALFANSLNANGSAGSSGVAELHGNDLIVTLGGYGFATTPGSALNLLINLQASTLMHELGHNLGLLHGGNEDTNYKPNHYSVMNYMYQFAGLSDTPNSMHAAERYYLVNSLKGKSYCNLVENSPCGSHFRMSYSSGGGADLDENNLFESVNIGRGSVAGAYADWDNDSALTALRLARNLNPQDGSARTTLRDFDEWGNLRFAFSRNYSGSNTGSLFSRKTTLPRANPMNQRAEHRLQEESLPALLHSEIRNHRHEPRAIGRH